MHRRTFVRVLTAGGVALVVQPPFAGCDAAPSAAYQAWSGPSPALTDEDVRLRIVSYGLLAPSIANLQPWWVSLKHPGILVALEPHRFLPHSDPDLHQTFVSHGAFIETLRLAAGEFGLAANVTPVPSGEPSEANQFGSPVARVDLAPDGARDPLTQQLIHRRTNRRPFRDDAVPSTVLSDLATAAAPHAAVQWITEPQTRRAIVDAVLEAAASSLDDPERYRETVATLRRSDDEVDASRDGITLGHLGLTPWSEWYERHVRSRASVSEGGMKERLLELTRRQAESAPAFGVITTASSGRVAELSAGAALMRVHLAATAQGVAFQPLNAPLEGRMTLPAGLVPQDRVPHILFRVGSAEPTAPSPRRMLFEVVQL